MVLKQILRVTWKKEEKSILKIRESEKPVNMRNRITQYFQHIQRRFKGNERRLTMERKSRELKRYFDQLKRFD